MGVVRLEYRKDAFKPLVRHISNDSVPRLTQLTTFEVRTLRAILKHDIPILYDAHIPYKLDISTMLISREWSGKLRSYVFKPLIDIFNLDLDPQDDSVPWDVHRESMIETASAQFAVLQVISEATCGPTHLGIRDNLQPDAAVDMLEKCRPPIDACNFVVRHVARYSPKLGRYMSRLAGNYLLTLPSREGFPERPDQLAQGFHHTVYHVLRLLRALAETENREEGKLLAGQAALLTVYTALLVHKFAKDIICDSSRGLVALNKDEACEMYIGIAPFKAVSNTRQELAEAIAALRAIGGELEDEERWFIEEHD